MRANQIQPPWRFDDPHVIRRGCPSCGSTCVARVLQGMQILSDQMERDLKARKIVFGGCELLFDFGTGHPMNPERACNDCGTEWGRWVGPQCSWPGAV